MGTEWVRYGYSIGTVWYGMGMAWVWYDWYGYGMRTVGCGVMDGEVWVVRCSWAIGGEVWVVRYGW